MNLLRRERRKRERIPGAILIVGAICLLYPFINYYHFVQYFGVGWKDFGFVLERLNFIQKFLFFFPFISGIGLLTVSLWGYVLFFVNAVFLFSFNMYALVQYPIQKNLFALLEVVLVTGICLYLLRKDIFIPFGKFSQRGFRKAKRKPFPMQLEIVSGNQSWKAESLDLSKRGFSVSLSGFGLDINSEVSVHLQIEAKSFQIQAGVVRKSGQTVAFAFRNISPEFKKLLKQELRK